ncbi:hypothetical protein B0I18_106137 [Taibaiella chishuiensis]|uniref:Uncharacterized protein n=2 Tax=Taibaiella chishuiensis TaxID=1434707 RepID=A0A2P8D1T1_9BACT|nr:hypothetical protein B0I18_106137 [Taibaiella chishuiensis]
MTPVLPSSTPSTQRKLVISRSTFFKILLVAGLGISGVWLAGLPRHHSLWHNTLVSSIAITAVFMLLITAALYAGIRPRCTPGKITGGIRPLKRFLERGGDLGLDLSDAVPDSLAGFLVALLGGILLGVVSGFLFWLLYAGMLTAFALLFLGFSKILLPVFRHRRHCSGNLATSVGYGLRYTLLYGGSYMSVLCLIHYIIL